MSLNTRLNLQNLAVSQYFGGILVQTSEKKHVRKINKSRFMALLGFLLPLFSLKSATNLTGKSYNA